jgi:hypothetical protein
MPMQPTYASADYETSAGVKRAPSGAIRPAKPPAPVAAVEPVVASASSYGAFEDADDPYSGYGPGDADVGPNDGGADDGGLYAVDEATDECPHCGRSMRKSALKSHISRQVCTKQRKVFDMRKQRVAGVLSVQEQRQLQRKEAEEKKAAAAAAGKDEIAAKAKWQREHEAFQASIKAGKQVSEAIKNGVDLRTIPVAALPEELDTRVPCPHCSRKFSKEVAERHVPACKNTKNKPAPPPTHNRRAVPPNLVGIGAPRGTTLRR